MKDELITKELTEEALELELNENEFEQESSMLKLNLFKEEVVSFLRQEKVRESISVDNSDLVELLSNTESLDSIKELIEDSVNNLDVYYLVKPPKNNKDFDIKYINKSINSGNYCITGNIPVDPQISPEGFVSINLSVEDLRDSVELSEFVENKMRESLDISEVKNILKEKKQETQSLMEEELNKRISNLGAVSFFKSNILDKIENGEPLHSATIYPEPYHTVESLAKKILSSFSIPMEYFKSYVKVLTKQDTVNETQFYEDYIRNNEHIFWNPEESGGVFTFFESKEIKELVVKRYLKSRNLSELSELSEEILDYIVNKDKSIFANMSSLRHIVQNQSQMGSVNNDVTKMMHSIGKEEHLEYNDLGVCCVSENNMKKFVSMIIADVSVQLGEDDLTFIYNKCNIDISGHEYPMISLKESLEHLLPSFIIKENCPSQLLKQYFLISPKVAMKIINSPRIESDESLGKDIFNQLKKKLNKVIDDSEWLAVYEKFLNFPYIDPEYKNKLQNTLISYTQEIKNSKDSSFLDDKWQEIYYYQPNSATWKYPFSIEGRQSELLTILVELRLLS